MPITPVPGSCFCAGGCSCLVEAGDNIEVTGSGTEDDPYIITGTGGGGCAQVELTRAEIIALQTAGTLDVCTQYVVTDYTATSLPGPNFIYARALQPDRIDSHIGFDSGIVGTAGLQFGPNEGEMIWAFGGIMQELEDPIGNVIQGTSRIANFPWGINLNWSGNKMRGAGAGMDAAAAAAAAGCTFANNDANGGMVDMNNWTSGTIQGNTFFGGTVNGGENFDMEECVIGDGTTISGSVTGVVFAASDTRFLGGTYDFSGLQGAAFSSNTLENCTITGNSDTGDLTVDGCNMRNAVISDNSTTGGFSIIHRCQIDDSTLTISGVGAGREINTSQIVASSVVNIGTNGTLTSGAIAMADDVVANGTLTVDPDGALSFSRVALGANLDTGAFASTNVVSEGPFTDTLTAANAGTGRNFSADTLV